MWKVAFWGVKAGFLRHDMLPFACGRAGSGRRVSVLVCFLSAFYCHNVTVGLIALIVSVLWRDNGVEATVTTVTCVTVVTVQRDWCHRVTFWLSVGCAALWHCDNNLAIKHILVVRAVTVFISYTELTSFSFLCSCFLFLWKKRWNSFAKDKK